MNALTHEHFQHWLESYGRASAENDPHASANLFTKNAAYYETPFAEPMVGRDAILQYWDKGAQSLKNKESTFEILSVQDQCGIARWQSRFTVIESGKRLALDCVFLVEFDDGKCSEFREWWHICEDKSHVEETQDE